MEGCDWMLDNFLNFICSIQLWQQSSSERHNQNSSNSEGEKDFLAIFRKKNFIIQVIKDSEGSLETQNNASSGMQWDVLTGPVYCLMHTVRPVQRPSLG